MNAHTHTHRGRERERERDSHKVLRTCASNWSGHAPRAPSKCATSGGCCGCSCCSCSRCCCCCKFMSRTARYIRHAAILCSVSVLANVNRGVWGGEATFLFIVMSDQLCCVCVCARERGVYGGTCQGRRGSGGPLGRFTEDSKRVAIISKRRPI